MSVQEGINDKVTYLLTQTRLPQHTPVSQQDPHLAQEDPQSKEAVTSHDRQEHNMTSASDYQDHWHYNIGPDGP